VPEKSEKNLEEYGSLIFSEKFNIRILEKRSSMNLFKKTTIGKEERLVIGAGCLI